MLVLDLLDFFVERETDLPATVLFRQCHGETSGILEDDKHENEDDFSTSVSSFKGVGNETKRTAYRLNLT